MHCKLHALQAGVYKLCRLLIIQHLRFAGARQVSASHATLYHNACHARAWTLTVKQPLTSLKNTSCCYPHIEKNKGENTAPSGIK